MEEDLDEAYIFVLVFGPAIVASEDGEDMACMQDAGYRRSTVRASDGVLFIIMALINTGTHFNPFLHKLPLLGNFVS